jgi:hypothetical protein
MKATWRQILARRMLRHGLSVPLENPIVLDGIAAAASAMVGVHAQVGDAAALSVAARVVGVTRHDIAVALAPGGPLVKTYGPRGTVHLLPSDELPLWCAALSAAAPTSSQPVGVRLDDVQTDAVVDAIAAALDEAGRAGTELDRDELDAEVVARLGPWAAAPVMPAFGGMWPRWRQAIAIAAHRGVLAFGSGRGARVTYRNPGVAVSADGEAALDWLLRRYLSSYGPATPAQFARWMAASPAWGARRFARLESELATVDGFVTTGSRQQAFVSASDTDFDAPAATGIRLLGHFDPYVVGSYPRELVYPGEAAARALNRGQAGNFPVLLLDGVVAGVWHAKRSRSEVAITIEPIGELSVSNRSAAEAECHRVAKFLGLEPRVAFGVVEAGAHA